jgi:hypothetical protein
LLCQQQARASHASFGCGQDRNADRVSVKSIYKYARLEVNALAEMLDKNACQPGRLLDANVSPLAWIMNQMLYDKFHGNGWVLNLLTGAFEKA